MTSTAEQPANRPGPSIWRISCNRPQAQPSVVNVGKRNRLPSHKPFMQRECGLDPHFRSGHREKCPNDEGQNHRYPSWIGDQVVTTDEERSHEQQR